MKTAVSIPDDLFAQAERLARRLNLTRSGLYAEALRLYLARRSDAAVTDALNRLYECDSSGLDGDLERAQGEILEREDW